MEAFKYCMEIESNTDLNSASSDQFSDCFFRQSNNAGENWENPGPFESALSSIVSSPGTATNSGVGDGFAIRELIGRLGNICNSGGENSANNSCYATPLNSPPKLNLSMPPPFSGDPGFAERAAKNSLFGGGGGQFALADPELRLKAADQFGDSREGSSVSDQMIIPAENALTRKRKSAQRSKASVPKQPEKVTTENEETKRSKRDGDSPEEKKEIAKPPEAPKDYIHVRARRGQATDSHSLAERVRREKISERMKFLQDLVPGCNKVTGKAVMLDEIINYVQSLQRQVEFLSMKLATVNPRTDFNMEALLSKDIFQSRGSLPHGIYPLDASALHSFPFGYQHQNSHQSQQLAQQLHNNDHTQTQFQVNPQSVHRTPSSQLAASNGFAESAHQVSTFFEDDLQSVVQMGFGQIQQQSFQGSMASGQMKVEL